MGGKSLAKGMNNPFATLKLRNFRYYWIGMGISVIGTWMQNIAQPWLAYTLTDSPFLLGLVSAMQFVPILLFSLFAGVIIDRFPKKRLLFMTQSLSLVVTLMLAVLTYLKIVQYWHILILSFLLGLVNALDMPLRNTFIIELVDKEHLMNAVALNSSMFNLARVIGPALAGVVMGYLGIATCFLINSISFAAVLISLFFIKTNPQEIKPRTDEKVWTNVKKGLSYIYKDKEMYRNFLVLAVVATFAMNFNVIVPVFAKTVLKQGEQSFGLLMSFMGAGSLLGALTVAAKSKQGPSRYVIVIFPLVAAAFHIFIGLTDTFLLAGLFLAVCGYFFVSFLSTVNTFLQLRSPQEFRGRILSVYTVVVAGSTPIGNLYAGAISDAYGAGWGFMACGAVILILLAPMYIYSALKRAG